MVLDSVSTALNIIKPHLHKNELRERTVNELSKSDEARIRTYTQKTQSNYFIEAKRKELKTKLKQHQNEFMHMRAAFRVLTI